MTSFPAPVRSLGFQRPRTGHGKSCPERPSDLSKHSELSQSLGFHPGVGPRLASGTGRFVNLKGSWNRAIPVSLLLVHSPAPPALLSELLAHNPKPPTLSQPGKLRCPAPAGRRPTPHNGLSVRPRTGSPGPTQLQDCSLFLLSSAGGHPEPSARPPAYSLPSTVSLFRRAPFCGI